MIVLANCSLLFKIEIFVSTLKNERGKRKTRTEREDTRRERKREEKVRESESLVLLKCQLVNVDAF